MKNQYEISDWEGLIEKKVVSEDEKKLKLTLVKNAYKNNVPVILDFKHLSLLLGIKEGIIASMIHSPKSFYREFRIPKKRGGYRDIVTPYQSLLEIQQWISEHIFSQLEVHNAAFAYVKKRNVALNANEHIGCKEMLKIDLKDFFFNIKIPRVRELFNRVGYSKEIAGYLTKLCCLDGALPQGAATSPIISNIILNTLDKRLCNFSKNNGIKYTRYADDIVFSGEAITADFQNLVIRNIQDSGFKINSAKTKKYREEHRKIVTGIVVSKDNIRLPKVKRREIKSEVYFLIKHGILAQTERYNDLYYIDRVLGRLSYWKQIEPKNEFVLQSIKEIKKMYKEFAES
ncbi:retron St85 family RNA-directed DNA polymerase [Lutibacter sp.]|uniref:retron St85 family RNA-directed DNA polymerase n=1 Tax=Lutibacter sp. TaxID=1925666 RepID=UPI00356534CB